MKYTGFEHITTKGLKVTYSNGCLHIHDVSMEQAANLTDAIERLMAKLDQVKEVQDTTTEEVSKEDANYEAAERKAIQQESAGEFDTLPDELVKASSLRVVVVHLIDKMGMPEKLEPLAAKVTELRDSVPILQKIAPENIKKRVKHILNVIS